MIKARATAVLVGMMLHYKWHSFSQNTSFNLYIELIYEWLKLQTSTHATFKVQHYLQCKRLTQLANSSRYLFVVMSMKDMVVRSALLRKSAR